MKTYRVKAAYVTLRVLNELGQEVLLGYYADAVLPKSVNKEDLDRHLRKDMVEEVDAPEPAKPAKSAPAAKSGPQAVTATPSGQPAAEPDAGQRSASASGPGEARSPEAEAGGPQSIESKATEAKPARPQPAATRTEWVNYAVANRGEGISEADAKSAAERMSKADLIAKYGQEHR